MDYKKVQKFHRKHNAHHLEYIGKHNWIDMIIDWECSRFTKESCPRTAIQEIKYKFENGDITLNEYKKLLTVANNIGLKN